MFRPSWRMILVDGRPKDKNEGNLKTLLQIEDIHQRLDRANESVASGGVHRIQMMKDYYTVAGDENGDFLVNKHCICAAARSRSSAVKGWCEHRMAVELFKRDGGKKSK